MQDGRRACAPSGTRRSRHCVPQSSRPSWHGHRPRTTCCASAYSIWRRRLFAGRVLSSLPRPRRQRSCPPQGEEQGTATQAPSHVGLAQQRGHQGGWPDLQGKQPDCEGAASRLACQARRSGWKRSRRSRRGRAIAMWLSGARRAPGFARCKTPDDPFVSLSERVRVPASSSSLPCGRSTIRRLAWADLMVGRTTVNFALSST